MKRRHIRMFRQSTVQQVINILPLLILLVSEAESERLFSEEQLQTGGYKVYTTLNTNASTIMEKAFADDSNFEKSVDDKTRSKEQMILLIIGMGIFKVWWVGRDYEKKGTNRVLISASARFWIQADSGLWTSH